MALPQLPDTLKGKTFGQISKDIEAKYKDRFDPISKRGLMAEMGALKEQQEYQKAKTEARQMLEQQMQQAQQINPMQDSMEQPMDASMVNPMEQQMGTPMESSNQGISPEMLPQDNTNFQHAASQSYNQQFAYGGNMEFEDQIQYGNGDLLNNNPFVQTNFFDRNQNLAAKNLEKTYYDSRYSRLHRGLPEWRWQNGNTINQNREIKDSFDRAMQDKKFTDSVNEKWNLDGAFKGPPRERGIQDSIVDAIKRSRLGNNTGSKVNPTAVTSNVNRTDFFEPTASVDNTNMGLSSFTNNAKPNINSVSNFNLQRQLPNIKNSILPNAQKTLDANSQKQNQDQLNIQGIDPMRFAPLAANLYGILSARKAPSTQAQLNKMGFRDRVDESLATRIAPRQTQFSNVDMSQIERGITDQARGFTGSNVNMSGGQSGNFMANELANQSNVMNAIANARAQAQMQNQQVRGMNAQEQARVDAMMQQQAMQRAGLQGQNIGLGMQMADFDARNLGAFNTNRMAQITGLSQNIGNIGKESDQMRMLANMYGYTSFGDYIDSLSPEEREKAMKQIVSVRRR
jgi:hypothetical protein